MDANIIDVATAKATLNKSRDDLAIAVHNSLTTTEDLHRAIVAIRPKGVLTVAEMAEAVDRDRNYIDSVWSTYGTTTKGKQTRVERVQRAVEYAHDTAEYRQLADAARNQRGTAATARVIRAERDRIVAMVYASKILGPSAIAAEVGVDRNHVLRIARAAGVAPAHRPGAKNQYSAKASK